MIDIGANLTNRAFRSDLDAVISRAADAGVTGIFVTGTSVDGSRAASELAATRPGYLWSTAGVHPHDAKGCDAMGVVGVDLCLMDSLAAFDVYPETIGRNESFVAVLLEEQPLEDQRAFVGILRKIFGPFGKMHQYGVALC